MDFIKPILSGTPAGVIRNSKGYTGLDLENYVTHVTGKVASNLSFSERVRFDEVHKVLAKHKANLVLYGTRYASDGSHEHLAKIYEDHLKHVQEQKMPKAICEEADADIQIHKRLRSTNIGQMLFCTEDRQVWIAIADFCPMGDAKIPTYHMFIAGDVESLVKHERIIEELAQCQFPSLAAPSNAIMRMEYLYIFGGELYTSPLELEFSGESIETHYEDYIVAQANQLIDSLTDKNKGIAILHGVPGSGKTSLLKHIISRVDKTFLFLSVDTAKILGDPSFGRMLLNHRDAVLIIEDAETVLAKRVKDKNSSVASVLNLTDGLLSDALGIQVLCTFNCSVDDVDPALLRPGRLLQNIEINSLSTEKANALRRKLGKEELNHGGTLAEIYAQESIKTKETVTAHTGAVTASV